MDSISHMEATKRSNRFSYDPVVKNDAPHVAELQRLDDRRFEAMAPYEYLTADYIAALTEGDAKSVTHRFNILKREPNRWIDIAAPMIESGYAKKVYRNDFLAYSLSPKAKQRLKMRGNPMHSYGCSGPFVHKLMTSWVRASFDIAVNVEKAAAEIIPWHTVIESDKTPARLDKTPHAIEVSFRYERENIKRKVFPDCYPFAVHNDDGYTLLFLEVDCDSEAIRNDLDLKLLRWLAILDQRLHNKRYGFTKAFVLIVTTSEVHMKNIMERLEELTEETPSLRKHFLFKRHPSLKSDDRPRATGHMLTEPYQRVGYPPFSFV